MPMVKQTMSFDRDTSETVSVDDYAKDGSENWGSNYKS